MRAKKIYEVQNFQRGLDPKTSLGIGKASQRDFSGGKELIEWAYNFPAVWSKGEIQEWKDSDYIIRKPLDGYFEEVYIQRMRNIKLIVIKWIKDNITINGEPLSLKESMNMFEEIQKFVIKKLEKERGIKENMEFEKGQDPKDALGIGVGEKLRMEGIDALTHFLYYANAKDMIKKVWNDWDHMWDKLKNKVGDGYMDPNALMSFIRDLDVENQKKLYDYIIKNHSNKW